MKIIKNYMGPLAIILIFLTQYIDTKLIAYYPSASPNQFTKFW